MAVLIFGGAFDPPHKEHKYLLDKAIEILNVEKAVIVPTYFPPHKDEGTLSFTNRCELCKLAFKNSAVETVVDGIEFENKNNNFSYLILPRLKEKYKDIIFLIGGDSAVRFGEWKNPSVIAKCCPIAIIGREGYTSAAEAAERLTREFDGEFIPLDVTGKNVSSSIIRAKLFLGLDTPELPDEVRDYIDKHKLFSRYKQMIDKLQCIQSPDLFDHSISVVLRAVDFNTRHNLKLPFEKVFIAALLHDNAKQRLSLDGINVPEDSIESPVLHQFLGAEKAKRDFNIDDEEILDAIRYHTTAKADMSQLGKLIYTSDSLSDDRKYEPIPDLKRIALDDFDRGFKSVLKYTYLKVVSKGKGVYPLTAQAKEYYLK